ncbi:DUF6461 domain-containing protein [Nonomuraea soli]|uniref:Uncharacterized protein n=1 Tax=Nonomuraea soli TaxID=1032476 RepID=A0A7W0CJ76_9ACTN|nr:DUF6461 domain-containing protein [Nonomuraea soli]MBA2892113.1 hypothetical protein [Nonomuraea soli]
MEENLNVPLCVTWIESMSVTETLVTAGGQAGGSGRRTFAQTVQAAYDALPGWPGAAIAGSLGSWTVLVEPNGFQGSRPEVLSRLAQQGRALSVFWNANGDGQLAYAEDAHVLAMVDLLDPEDFEDLPPALSAWPELAEQDDLRSAALTLGELLTGERLEAQWLDAEHQSAMLDAFAEPADGPPAAQDELDHLAYLAGDPRVADLIAVPHPDRAREIAALVAETACELSGLREPVADRVLAALTGAPSPDVLAELRADIRLRSQEMLTRSPDASAPTQTIERWQARYQALSVLEAAVEEDALTAARDAIWRVGMLRLNDRAGRRVGALMSVLARLQS